VKVISVMISFQSFSRTDCSIIAKPDSPLDYHTLSFLERNYKLILWQLIFSSSDSTEFTIYSP